MCLLMMLLVRPIAMSLMSFHRSSGLVAERRSEVEALRKRNADLKASRNQYRQTAFIIQQARLYGLVLPGESAYVVRELAHPEAVGSYISARAVDAVQTALSVGQASRSQPPADEGRTPRP